jgi:hypothetical protein
MNVRGEILQVVTQRVSRSRLLVSEAEDRWFDMNRPGLVFYLSFVTTGPDQEAVSLLENSRFSKAIKSLLNANLASSSGWKTDHSDAQSILRLAAEADVQLIIIPQATLSGRLISGDKYLKYHRQVDKSRGFELYSQFIRTIAGYLDPAIELDTAVGGEIRIGNLNLAWGSYGKRQAWEMTSSGPSTHYFEF